MSLLPSLLLFYYSGSTVSVRCSPRQDSSWRQLRRHSAAWAHWRGNCRQRSNGKLPLVCYIYTVILPLQSLSLPLFHLLRKQCADELCSPALDLEIGVHFRPPGKWKLSQKRFSSPLGPATSPSFKGVTYLSLSLEISGKRKFISSLWGLTTVSKLLKLGYQRTVGLPLHKECEGPSSHQIFGITKYLL